MNSLKLRKTVERTKTNFIKEFFFTVTIKKPSLLRKYFFMWGRTFFTEIEPIKDDSKFREFFKLRFRNKFALIFSRFI